MNPALIALPDRVEAPQQSPAAAAALQAHFVPHWPKNPYQSELARHLAACGVVIRRESRLKEILAVARQRGTPPDVLHLHALPRFTLHPGALLRLLAFFKRLRSLRAAGTRIVWTIHNVADHESAWPRIDRAISRWSYHFADALILHSHRARDLVESQWHVAPRENVSVIPHGHFIDCYPHDASRSEARRQLQLPEQTLVFLFLGQIRPYKGVPRLVQVFKQVAPPRARLVIAGEALSPDLDRKIRREIGADERVLFHSRFLPDNEIPHYLAAADVAVFPYSQALTSGALVLAMSFGCACIAPEVGALADTLDADGGFRYPPADPDGLPRALLQAAQQSDQLPRMGAHNRARAALWKWDEIARLTASVYRALPRPRT